jgi:hypothetical protein
LKHRVVVVMVHSISLSSQGKGRQVSLQLQHLLLTPPLGLTLDRLQSVDLPFHGRVAVGHRDVTVLPYVGEMDLVGPGGDNNANIQQTDSGFIIRGLVSEGASAWWAAAAEGWHCLFLGLLVQALHSC